jgi:hypothetical protein
MGHSESIGEARIDEAARPLRRYGARVRAASLPPTYTIAWDMTTRRASQWPRVPECPKN